MAIFYVLLAVLFSTMGTTTPMPNNNKSLLPPIVSREEWNAEPPKEIVKLQTPIPYVVVHHSYTPPACYTKEDCCKSMRTMQHMHQITNGWADIGYNFAVGSDGLVYEGRGWNRVGAHSLRFNTQSLGIVLIGDWSSELPPEIQLQTAKQLIAEGVRLGWVSPKYKLVGHRQVRDTECPGNALYSEISTWKHFDDTPHMIH